MRRIRQLIAVLMLALFLLSSCDSLPELPWSGDSDDSDISSEERDRDRHKDRDKDRDEDRSEPGESDPNGPKLSDFLTGLIARGGSAAGDGSAAGSAAPDPGTPSGGSYEFFSQLPENFTFSSGAGAWGTFLSIAPDGSFTGDYFDGNMGETGDGYPNGTTYICSFSGQLSAPVQVNDYTWSTHMLELNTDGTPGDVSYEDGVRYINSEAYGISGADEILIYCPNAPVAELPEEFTTWVYWDLSSASGDTLNFYGLYNVNGQAGFSGYIYP